MDEIIVQIGWVVVCLAVPIVWGIAVNKLFDVYSSRRGAGRDSAPPEYHI